jgi:outer membrane lipoprotein LolB
MNLRCSQARHGRGAALAPRAQAVGPALSRRAWLGAHAGLTAVWGAGCASRPPAAAADSLSGRLILRISPSGSAPARQWSAGFELRGTAQAGELDLTSPLGSVVAQARWKPGQAELDQGGERWRFDDLTDLSRQLLGEAVPLAALFDWLRGQPWPAEPHERTSQGFVQRGWAVDLSALGDGTLTAQREQAPAITLRARLQALP